MELRNRDEAQAWVAGGLCLSRLASLDEALELAAPWLIESVSETGRILPAGVVLDLGRLFSGHPLRRSVPLPAVAPPLRAALRSYEDHVLGRLESSALLDSLIDAFAPLNSALRARAVAVVSSSIIERLGVSTVAVSPGILRRVVATPADELATSAAEALVPGTDAFERLAAGYRDLTERAHRAGKLITEADVFVVEHIGVLADLTQRLAISEILEASQERRMALPKRIKARRRPKKKQVMTALSDEDHYPTGGFSSIATSGSMENLVISELIYMEDPTDDGGGGVDGGGATEGDGDGGGGVDLFDLRYAEGELLYYTRDESQFVRDHRAIGFALAGNLTRARIKDRGARRQRLIELFASLHCTVNRLAEWLSEQALHIAIRTIDSGGKDTLAAERALLEVLFVEDIERGLVTIGRAATAEAAISSEIGDPRAEPEWVVISSSPTSPELLTSPERSALSIGKKSPSFQIGGSNAAIDLATFDEATLALLHRLV